MHHMYPLAKGDSLCPLGFHPQVRWPTRCKRCFRDYKEHGGKRREDDSTSLRRDTSTASTPSLSWTRDEESEKKRSWMSSTNLAGEKEINNSSSSSDHSDYSVASSWTSTPDLANLQDDTQAVTFSIKLPKKKQKPIDTGQRTDSFNVIKEKPSAVFNKSDNLAARAKKLQAIKESTSVSTDKTGKRIQIKEVKTISEEPTNHDVQFLIQVKAKTPKIEEPEDLNDNDDDTISLAGTETTDTTLVDIYDNEYRDQLESLKRELETTKIKCDRLEREKSDILLRRLAAMETTPSKTKASEVLKLQQKCNELQQQLEDYKDEKKSLSMKVKELEEDLELRPTAQQAQKIADELRSKLLAAETLCEELMDENEDIKKELRDMEEQMDEMQDNFREDQAVEYTSIKKELDQTTKNCRILSFKLRKAERKSEQLEHEKNEMEKKFKDVTGGASTLIHLERIKHLEQELKVSNEVSLRLQKEVEEAQQKLSKLEENKTTQTAKKKAPLLGNIGKVPSGDGKVSRESLTRGGSQDDPAQLLRDLQDSLEREADLREQLKFAEEEAQNLRKKVSRIEDDNESLVLQLKKMATRARSRKLSPTNQRLTPEPQTEKGEISDDDDPSELKLQLELSEQEVSVLRKKVEELEADNHRLKSKTKELQEKCNAKSITKRTLISNDKGNSLQNQKLKILEDETNDLRKKLIEKERDCERLHAELSLNQKRSKGIQKSKSLDLDQQTLDLKRQLQVIEQEAAILRNKVQTLETENEKLSNENKRLNLLRGAKNFKSDKSLETYINQIAILEIELDSAKDKIKELEKTKQSDKISDLKGESQYKKFIQRTPKKVTTLTSRDQLKLMVSDLEKEIGEILVVMKTHENAKIKLEEEIARLKENSDTSKALQDLEEINKKYESIQKELAEEKANKSKENRDNDDLNKTLTKTKDSLDKLNDEKKKLKDQVEKLTKDQLKNKEEKKKLDEEIASLKTSLKSAVYKQDEITILTQKSETLKINLETKEKEMQKLKKELEEKSKLETEANEKSKKISELEKKLTEFEEKYNKCNKELKDKNKDYDSKIDKEKQQNKLLKNDQVKWEEDKKKLNNQLEEFNTKIKGLENTIESKNDFIKQLEESLAKEREIVSKTNLKVDELENREINKLKDELSKNKVQLSELESKLEIAGKNQKNLEDKLKKSEQASKTAKTDQEKKIKDMELELQNEKKKLDVLKTNHEKEQKNRELELSTLKSKIKKLELGSGTATKKDIEIKQLKENAEKLESSIQKEKQKYDDLTAKYEILEEEHVVTKAKLVMEKETLDNQLISIRRDKEQLENELKTLRDTYNTKQDTLKKEKLDLQEKLKEANKAAVSVNDYEKTRLKSSLEEKQSEYDQLKKEYDVINDQMECMRKDNDELKRKLDDYEKVNKIQRTMSADSTAMEKEIKQLRIRLSNIEKSKKSDLAECKMRYESQLSIVNGELQSLQNQVLRFKRERDTYKHMLESAQKTIGDLKQSPRSQKDNGSNRVLHYDELEESRSKIATLEQQISCMEDEMSESRLECSRLKTELVSERSSWEVKLSELHSRVNELEEEKVLSSGRTKIVGLRTRMELAWQKEREEQQRLLQETATLARDLRQTLFEVERERDKERLEAKRKQEQFKKTSEEEQEETKRKITELQCDLLELRDAHAKLRTTNEKLRREKERYEKEREELRSVVHGKKRADQEDDRKISSLIENIDTLKQVAPELFFVKELEAPYTPTPPRRTRSKSRETSPAFDRREASLGPEEKQQQINYIMQRLVNTTEDLRKLQKYNEDEYERERIKRTMGMRRATSSEHENVSDSSRYNKPYMRKSSVSSNLHRKSLSLEHTMQNEQKIWKNESDSMSSLQSLESDIEGGRGRRDASLDSRLSGGSTQSDIGDKKKKKGIFGKLKKLTKSRSIDDDDPGVFSPTRSLSSRPSSNSDVNEDPRGSKKDLKERITGIFKKSGSTSRSNSVERQERRRDTSSTQRPLMRNGSNSNLANQSSSSSINYKNT